MSDKIIQKQSIEAKNLLVSLKNTFPKGVGVGAPCRLFGGRRDRAGFAVPHSKRKIIFGDVD
jgi:hypothetical protein